MTSLPTPPLVRAALRVATLTTLALALLQPALAGKGRPVPTVVDDALSYVVTDRDKSARILEDAIAHRDGLAAVDLPAVLVHAGEQRRLLDDTEAARRWFEQAVSQGKDWEVQAGLLGLALLAATDGASADPGVATWATLQDVADEDALDTQNADRYLLLALRAARDDDATAVREHTKKALAFAKADPDVDARVRETLERLAAPPTGDTPAPPALDVLSDLERGERALATGDNDEARRLAEKVIARAEIDGDDADPAELLAARYLLRRIDAVPVAPHRVGVLLPLSGRYEAVGKQMQQAIEFGWKAGKGQATLEFVDSGSTPATAVKALDTLVLERGVIAVIGPLLSDETAPVAEAAQAMRVPLISLSQGMAVDPDQTWVYHGMVTPHDQVRALVDYAMGERKMTDFAIFAPDTSYGHTATDAFTEAVTARGGKIRVTEFYDPEATDLIPDAKKLGRKDYEARKSEYWELRRETSRKGGNPERVVLPPILDFQGLFLPDSTKRIPIATAALAYEEFPMGDFQPTKTSPIIPMLGLSGWNSDSLLTAGPYVRNSIFTDAWFPDGEVAGGFAATYAEKYGRTPGPIEAVAVDTGRLVARADVADPSDRAGFREALKQARSTASVTGATSFDPTTRSSTTQIRLLTVTAEGIRPLDRTPAESGTTDATPTDGAPTPGR